MPPKHRKGGHSSHSCSSRSNKSASHSHCKSHNPSAPSSSSTSDQATSNVCPICAESVQDWAIGTCGHIVCGDCSHRMRVLYNSNTCAMCNALLKQVALVPLRHYRPAMSFETAISLPGVFLDRQVSIWFIDRARHQQLKNTRGWKCSHKACNGKGVQEALFQNSTLLRAHARSEHRAVYCEICFTGEKSFVSEMPLYNLDSEKNHSSRLRTHLRKEHPQCRFCRQYYLDDEKLYAHLQDKHETCSICERNGRMHEYFANYAALESHFQKEHYVCSNSECRGLVFATHIELQAHEHSRHSDASRTSRARALRVNLQQLHGERDPRQRNTDSPADLQRERDRQTARRRAFLSSTVVFSGALTVDDQPNGYTPNNTATPSQSSTPSQSRASSSNATSLSRSSETTTETRRPDDGKFHPLALPRDGDESQARNTLLVRSMRSLLDPASYEQFRMSSGQFHSGKISADDYYDAVVDAFGVRAAVRDILPELVALLPTPLLREPLLETCLQRTDTKPSGAGYLGPSTSPDTASSSSARRDNEEDQFPTLNGAPAPRRALPPARRYRKPGPEDFPRLGKVNKPGGDEGSSSASSSAASSCRGGPSKASAAQQRSAAAVLRQPAHAQRVFGNQRVQTSAPRASPSPGAQLPANAFPSLSSSSVSTSTSGAASSCAGESSIASSAGPSPDVSMRVGPVWGGSTNSRGGKKRGPGKGQGRRPASPPKRTVVVGSVDEFPDIRARARPDNCSSSSHDRNEQNSCRRAPVVDVVEIAKSRKAAVAKSNLPKIGGSGYGFAWDRKKAQQKRKEIKKSVAVERETNVGSRSGSSSVSDSMRSRGREETTNFENGSEIEQSETTTQVSEEQQPFDPYSYMKNEIPDEDPVTANGFSRSSR